MQELKTTISLLTIIVLTITFTMPAQAQPYGGPGPFGGSGDSQFSGGPMGIGSYGMDMPFMPPGMQGMSGMPFPGMFGRQSERVTAITRLPAPSGQGKDLVATLEGIPQLSIFTAALKATGYGEKLKGEGNYLLFVPSDKAIARDLSVKDAGSLISDTKLVTGLMENSIAYQPSGQQDKDRAFVALNGKEIKMLKTKAGVSANGADVSSYVAASNGLIIVTDGAVGT